MDGQKKVNLRGGIPDNGYKMLSREGHLPVLSPLVLPADLFLLLGREIIGDVEGLADLLRRLALDHVSDGLAANIEQSLDVEVVCSL